MNAQRYTVEFPGDAGTGPIEITYWVENWRVVGTAYFKKDDYGCLVSNGEFEHPYSGLKYKLHVPCTPKHTDCILDVLRWANVGRSEPRSESSANYVVVVRDVRTRAEVSRSGAMSADDAAYATDQYNTFVVGNPITRAEVEPA
jgi:hypothetical protein